MVNFQISASILSANFSLLGEEVERVLKAGVDMVHVDVMDYHYVPNLTFGPLVCRSLREYGITAPLDVHLMVNPVDSLILPFIEAGANVISFHPDTTHHVDRVIQLIKSHGVKAGIVLNPSVSPDILDYVLDKIDMVLVMSVNPGFSGQSFIPNSLHKIKKVREKISDSKRNICLSVDGGVNLETIRAVAEAGADTFVMGAALFGSSDYNQTVLKLREELKKIHPL